jgi:hypothetical protein
VKDEEPVWEDKDPEELVEEALSALEEAEAYLYDALELLRPRGAKSEGGVVVAFRKRRRGTS